MQLIMELIPMRMVKRGVFPKIQLCYIPFLLQVLLKIYTIISTGKSLFSDIIKFLLYPATSHKMRSCWSPAY